MNFPLFPHFVLELLFCVWRAGHICPHSAPHTEQGRNSCEKNTEGSFSAKTSRKIEVNKCLPWSRSLYHITMASSNDVRDIMGMERSSGQLTMDKILADSRKKAKKSGASGPGGPSVGAVGPDGLPLQQPMRRPEGMARELYNLLYNDNKDAPPIIPTDSGLDKGYRHVRAKLGMRRVRPWKWMPFTNPARRDGLVLYHWRRAADEGREYPFAKYNRRLEMPVFNDMEYQAHLQAEGWTRDETDHLLDLCRRFDLRFPVIQDRWDRVSYKTPRSIEDLKERYYGICEKLESVRPDPARVAAGGKVFSYDADHERRRKEQLNRLYNRTPEQVEEEEMLKNELKKIEARKKEREKKTQDLQKLIAQVSCRSIMPCFRSCVMISLCVIGFP